MKLSFGIHLAPGLFLHREQVARVADLVKMAEDYGVEAYRQREQYDPLSQLMRDSFLFS